MASPPPFTLTAGVISLIAEISEQLGRLAADADRAGSLRLRRANRIRSIQGSLAIEGNTLSTEQITAILDGQRVIAPPREIQEVRNAIAAYDMLPDWQSQREADLLVAHERLMRGLVDDAGRYRTGGVGVMSGEEVIHMAPPASQVPRLMANLFQWLSGADQHPLISSCVFHYEFEFIHPFSDGNGRLGRLWQTLILHCWNPLFSQLPVESVVHEHQQDYYAAIAESTAATDSAPFIEFMLARLLEAAGAAPAEVMSLDTPQVAPQVTPQVGRLLSAMEGDMSRRALQQKLGLSDVNSFRARYLRPALDAGLIKLTIPEKPNSRLQRYRITAVGKLLLKPGESP